MFSFTPCLQTCTASLTSASPPEALQLMSLPSFTLGFALDGVQSMDFDKCVMTLAYHYSIIQNSFTVLKDLRAPPIQNPLLIYVRCY